MLFGYNKFGKGLVTTGFVGLACASVAMSGAAVASPTAEIAVPQPHANGQEEAAGEKSKLAMAQSYLGHAPYICTPSGFGNKARCFLRASIRPGAAKGSRF